MDEQFLIQQANKVYDVNVLEKTRTRNHCFARLAVSIYLRKENYTFGELGKLFEKTHSSIVHSVSKHDDYYKFDKEYKAKFNEFVLAINMPVNNLNFIKLKVDSVIEQLIKEGLNFEQIQDFWSECLTIANNNNHDTRIQHKN